MAENSFWSLKKEIEEELHSVSVNLFNVTDNDLDEGLYFRFSRQLDHIQNLFDSISEVNKELILDQSNPDLYKLLEAKQAISGYYGQFYRLRQEFSNRFSIFRDQQEDTQFSSRSVINEQDLPVEDIPEEVLEEEVPKEEFESGEAIDPEEDKSDKSAKRKERQKKLAEEAHKKDKLNADQKLRQEEAAKLGMDVRPEKQVSEADLYKERVLQDEAQRQQEQDVAGRIERENELLRKANARQEASDRFVHLENQHIDLSRDGLDHNQPDSFPEISSEFDSPQINTRTDPELATASPQTSSTNNSNARVYSALMGSEMVPEEDINLVFPAGDRHIQFSAESQSDMLGLQDDYRSPNIGGETLSPPSEDANSNSVLDPMHPAEQSSGKADVSSSFEEPFVPYQFSPSGVIPAPYAQNHADSYTAESNAKIYATLMENHTTSGSEPILVSSAVEAQMRFNVEKARLACIDASGTDASPAAVHAYLEQRNVLAQYRSAIQQGTIQIKDEHASYVDNRKPRNEPESSSVVYSFTPTGTKAETIENAHSTGNRYEFVNPGLRYNPAYSANNPMMVSPAYEEAITNKMHSATEALNAVLHDADCKAGDINPFQVKLYTDAYLGFQNAKRNGSVIISSDENSASTPDYLAWQQRHLAYKDNRVPFSSQDEITAQSFGAGPNQSSKKYVEENVANIFGQSNRLKQQSVAHVYAKQVGSRFQSYSYQAFLHLSQKMYRVVQSGEDNAIRTFESGRYYITTSAGIVLAIRSGSPTNAVQGQIASAFTREFHRYGTRALLNDSQLSVKVNDFARRSRELSVKLESVEQKMQPYIEKMEAYLRVNPSGNKLDGLDKHSQIRFQRLSSEANQLRSALSTASKEYSLHHKLQSARHNTKLEKELLEQIKINGKLPTKPKAIQEAIKAFNDRASAEMKKKYGNLTKLTDKSLAEQIELMKTQGKDLKKQIKLLEQKGSALTLSERKLLKQLKDQSKALGKKTGKYIQLSRDRADLAYMNKRLDEMLKASIKKNARVSNGLYALQGFMLRGLQAGYDSSTEGLARMIQISTNRYVHILVKKAYKASMFMTKGFMNMTVPGSVQAIETSVGLAKLTIKSQVNVAKTTIKSAVKTGVKTVGNLTKRGISKAVPTGIKTAVKTGLNAAATATRAVKSKFDAVKLAIDKAKAWAANTRLGRAASAVSRGASAFNEAMKTALSFLKGIAIKGALIFLAIYLVVGIFTVAISSAVGGSVIAAPGKTADGKIDLSPYVQVIVDEESEINERINTFLNDPDYDKVIVNYSGGASNMKEMLAMMAVRMEQELKMEENEEIEQYLRTLYHDSHAFNTSVRKYSCNGCKSKVVTITALDPDTGEKVIHQTVQRYCEGHKELTVTLTILGFDEIFKADSSVYGSTKLVGNAVTEKVWNYLKDHGMTDIQAAAIMGNIQQESGFRTGATNSSGGAYGLFQWLGDRKKQLQNYAASLDKKPSDLQTQLDFFWHEFSPDRPSDYADYQWISSHYPLEDFLNAKTLDAATKLFCFGWERPGNDGSLNKRISAARTYYNMYKGTDSSDADKGDSVKDKDAFTWSEEKIKWCELIYNGNWGELYSGFYNYGAGSIETGDIILSADTKLYWPLCGNTNIVSKFGWRIHPVYNIKKFHSGVDIPAEMGTPIHAAADGKVLSAHYSDTGGYMIVVDHGDGLETRYLHCSMLMVSSGDTIKANQVIGLVGNTGVSTGPHLHFSVYINGNLVDPVSVYGLKVK